MQLGELFKAFTSALFGHRSTNAAPEAPRRGGGRQNPTVSSWTDDHGIERSVTDVFVSYSSRDLERVRKIVERLNEERLTVSWDRDIPAGQPYTKFLKDALDHSRVVLVVWSRESVGSDWVVSEAEYARARKRLVSCRIEMCTPSPPFNTFQTANLSDWAGDAGAQSWREVVDLISHRVRTGDARIPLGGLAE